MSTRIDGLLSSGKRRFVSRLSLLALSSVAMAGIVPAHAAVGVTLRVSPAHSASPVAIKTCSTSVAAGADGIAVLNAAKNAGCISSFATKSFSFGTYVTCIDGVCQVPDKTNTIADGLATFWLMSVNKVAASYGVDAYEAAAGDTLEFSYSASALCFVPC